MGMKNKVKILEIINKQGNVTSREITKNLGVSRQYVNIVVSELIQENKIIKLGGTRNAFYVSRDYAKKNPSIIPKVIRRVYKNIGLEEHTALLDIENGFPKINEIRENIKSIFTFAFSEMFNNAIEHSLSKRISVEISVSDDDLSFIVSDSGVGVFRNIMKKRGLHSEIEAIQDLLKGKTTTMPKSHSGEGIFFTYF